jgi:hypothetical protein
MTGEVAGERRCCDDFMTKNCSMGAFQQMEIRTKNRALKM